MRKFNTVLIRYSEIGLKTRRVRKEFEEVLINNVRETYLNEGVSFTKVVRRVSRIVAYSSDPKVRDVTKLVLGVKSYSPALEVPAQLDLLKEYALVVAKEGEGSFAVRAQRVTKEFPLTSVELARVIGGYIKEKTGREVNLKDPDQVIGIEIIGKAAYLFDERIEGFGGLPVGTQGKVLALISDGIDSPVAAWLMMRRGAEIIPVHFRITEEGERRFREVLKVLRRYSYGHVHEPIIVDHYNFLSKASEAREWTCLLCKRRMLVEASKIAERHGALAVVMGDSLGQVASQTLHNMAVTSRCLPVNVLRPLIGMDKDEIMDLARKIGTYEITARKTEGCPFAPLKPKTRGNWEEFSKVVKKVGIDDLLDSC